MAEHPKALDPQVAVMVVGAGTMGSGIAEVAACAGHRVYLRDTQPAALERGLTQVRAGLERRVARGRLTASQREAILARLHGVGADEVPEGLGLVIEVIVEQLEAKVALLRDIEARVPATTVLATNTSSISVTAIAGRLARPAQVVGMHFFNPATALPLVEVVRGAATDAAVVDAIADTARAWGKVPVVCGSTPGFIVNRVARPFYGEALRLLQSRAATPAVIDAVMREAGGFRMGPCELMDLIGHDVNFAVTRSVCEGFFGDPRYQPSLVQRELVDAGWLGRKSGRGFYDHAEGAPRPPVPDAAPTGRRPAEVICAGDLGPAAGWRPRLAAVPHWRLVDAPGAGLLRVDGRALALTDGRSATERAVALGEPVVLFDLVLDPAGCTRVALAAADQADVDHLALAVGLFAGMGCAVSVIDDVPGLIVMRTVAMLVNEADEARQQGLAEASDIDAAMRQGVNYPRGPLAWGEDLGAGTVATVLRHLAVHHGDGRYRVAPGLQRAAAREVAHG